MIQLRYILTGAMFLVVLAGNAQNSKLQMSAELRPRIIFDGGYKIPKENKKDSPFYTTQRTRLNALFINDKIQSYISLQDVRLWGADDNFKKSGVYGNTQSLCLHQAWVKINITKPLTLKVGRQIFSFDDQRIISARNWNDYQVTYDALLAEYKTDLHWLHVGLSYNTGHKTDLLLAPEKFKTFDFIHYQYQLNQFTLSCVSVLTGNTLSDTSHQVFYRGTYGVYTHYKTNTSNARLSAYYQHNMNDIGGQISALCVSGYFEYAWIEALSLGLGYDYLSGNDEASRSKTNHRFDILYGRRHGWYGYMDYFSNTPEQGLQDCMAKLTYKPKKEVRIELHYHYFMLAADQFDPINLSKKLSPKLGNELDLKMKWKFNEIATIECGYSIYGTSTTLEQLKKLKDGDLKTPQFCYFMLTIKPSFWLLHASK